MIRSSLSIYLSIDLPLVALIIKVRSATWHAPRIFLLTRQGNQKTPSRGSKIHGNRIPRVSKSIQKAASKRYCSGESLRTSIFSKNCDFSRIFGFQNGTKIEEKMLKMRCSKTMLFWIDFYWIFFRFGLRKWNEISLFLDLYRKSWFCENHCFSSQTLLFLLVHTRDERYTCTTSGAELVLPQKYFRCKPE